ncbi:MAG: photosynthetic reaction center cytochrome c subunit family protein [Acidobacteriota bacterium]
MNQKTALTLMIAVYAATGLASQVPMQVPPPPQVPGQGDPRSPIPDTFSNLQVLPKDIAKPQLVNIMKSLALTFEKRCSYCHVATDDLSQADFASDEKATKKQARQLLQLVRDLQRTESAGKHPAVDGAEVDVIGDVQDP